MNRVAKSRSWIGSRVAVAVLLSTVDVAGQSQPDPKLIKLAHHEGRMVWWTTTNLDLSRSMLERFEKKYPAIKTELFRSGRGPLLNKIITEALTGRHAWDVLSGSGEMYQPLLERGLVASHRSAESKAFDDTMKGRAGDWVANHVNTYVLGFNTRLVKKEEVPRSYEALLDPRWLDGKISLDSDGYPLFIGLAQAWGREKAVSYFRRLTAQRPVVKRGNDERVQLAAAGEYSLVMAYASTIDRMVHKGAPLAWQALEPVVVQVNPIQLATRAPHSNAARLFIDFALSKEGQEMIRNGLREPARSDVESKATVAIRHFKQVVVGPEDYRDYKDNARLYQEILKTR